jgi:hypothetical protein
VRRSSRCRLLTARSSATASWGARGRAAVTNTHGAPTVAAPTAPSSPLARPQVTKRPKIQRLVTPLTLQRKRALVAAKRTARETATKERAEYEKLLVARRKERRASALAEKLRRSSRKSSKKAEVAAA